MAVVLFYFWTERTVIPSRKITCFVSVFVNIYIAYT